MRGNFVGTGGMFLRFLQRFAFALRSDFPASFGDEQRAFAAGETDSPTLTFETVVAADAMFPKSM